VPDDEKGKFAANIGQDVIDAALKAVASHNPAAPAAEGTQVPVEAPAAGDPRDEEITTLKAQLEFSMGKGREMLEKLKEEHERMLRAVADLDNYRKRAQKEKEEIQKFGVEKLLKDFLPVIDNLDRALEHGTIDFESLKKGVAMTRKLFEDTLGRHGVRPFVAVGKAFDPRLHEAMQQVETADVPPNPVISELVRGYTLNERLMRPALVAVSKLPPAPAKEVAAAGVKEGGGVAADPAVKDPGATSGGGGGTGTGP
jgi:molecular chaperone GrpE